MAVDHSPDITVEGRARVLLGRPNLKIQVRGFRYARNPKVRDVAREHRADDLVDMFDFDFDAVQQILDERVRSNRRNKLIRQSPTSNSN
jgi:hypothetical protein